MRNRTQKSKISFRERLYRWMYGRNGADALGRALLVVYLILVVVNLFLPQPYSLILSVIETALGVYIIYRILSRNLYQRQRENQWYLRLQGRFTGYFKLQKNKRRDRKTHVYRKCKHCKSVLRLPRSKGKHTVNCPCCHRRFDVTVR